MYRKQNIYLIKSYTFIVVTFKLWPTKPQFVTFLINSNYGNVLHELQLYVFFPVIDFKHKEDKGEKAMEEADEVIHSDKENETNQIMVLPTCDNLGESTQLARNNKSFIDTSSTDLEKGIAANVALLTFGITVQFLRHPNPFSHTLIVSILARTRIPASVTYVMAVYVYSIFVDFNGFIRCFQCILTSTVSTGLNMFDNTYLRSGSDRQTEQLSQWDQHQNKIKMSDFILTKLIGTVLLDPNLADIFLYISTNT